MSEPFLGELRIVSFSFAPKGWALANGQLLPINQNQALFALLGTHYGGDGMVNFALPDLRGRVPIHVGAGYVLGERVGQSSVTLSVGQLPAHTHPSSGTSAAATATTPGGQLPAAVPDSAGPAYAAPTGQPMHADTGSNSGSGQPHENRQPYLTLNVVIALQGIMPSRN